MAAVEASIDKDWLRIKGSLFWATGDDDVNDGGEGIRFNRRHSGVCRWTVQRGTGKAFA
jgi:hypothetical protein